MMFSILRRLTTTSLVIALLAGFAHPARAQASSAVASSNAAMAEALYTAAMALMEEKKYAEAARKLEESNRLDPGLGTRFHLAECYEHLGRMASAWGLFLDVAAEAGRTGQTDKAKIARQRADKLESLVPKLEIRVPETVAKIPGVQVRDNDNLLNPPSWDQSLPVDPGEHTITVTAPGRQAWRTSVDMQQGDAKSIVVAEPRGVPIGPIVLGSVGLAGVIVGSVFGVRTMNGWKEVVDYACENQDPTKCDMQEVDAKRTEVDVDRSANVSTATFIVGGVALAGAAVWAFWPQKDSQEKSRTSAHVWFVPAPFGRGIMAVGTF